MSGISIRIHEQFNKILSAGHRLLSYKLFIREAPKEPKTIKSIVNVLACHHIKIVRHIAENITYFDLRALRNQF